MSTPFVAPGPFARLTAMNLPGSGFQLRILRDDGLLYTPQSAEQISITLYAESGQLIFRGSSKAGAGVPGALTLSYEESVNGVVRQFSYQGGYYTIDLNSAVVQQTWGLPGGGLRCFLETAGELTLATLFPRVYAGVGSPIVITPGRWQVTVPYWSVSSHDTFPNITTTVRTTTVSSSVPYESIYRVLDGNALGYFSMPQLGVVWRPNANLSDWVGQPLVNNVCLLGRVHIPWQYPNITPPVGQPMDAGQRIHQLYQDVVLQVGLGGCPSYWQEMAVTISSNFGYSDVISFRTLNDPLFQAEYPLGRREPAALMAQTFERTYHLQWDSSTFPYDTGEGTQYHVGQTATLVQSPVIECDQFTVVPLPETIE